jgi:hypothetical protein
MWMTLSQSDYKHVLAGVGVMARVPWQTLADEFKRKDYLDVGDAVVSAALDMATPWLPGASAAKMVIHAAVSVADEHAGSAPTKPLTPQEVYRGLLAASSVDWKGYYKALKDDNGIVAGAETAQVFATLAEPFFPPATFAIPALEALAVIGGFTRPANPDHIDGYHWDALKGFVRDSNGQKPEDPDANNPLAQVLKWLEQG